MPWNSKRVIATKPLYSIVVEQFRKRLGAPGFAGRALLAALTEPRRSQVGWPVLGLR
jgi:hypothetical protein